MNQLYIKNVVSLELDKTKCTGCQMCLIVCPHSVFEMSEKKAFIKYLDHCMECGACAKNCKETAITVNTGVGCAYGVINGWIKGTEPSCDCSSSSSCC